MATEEGQGHLWPQQKWHQMLKEKGNGKLRDTLELQTKKFHVWCGHVGTDAK